MLKFISTTTSRGGSRILPHYSIAEQWIKTGLGSVDQQVFVLGSVVCCSADAGELGEPHAGGWSGGGVGFLADAAHEL